MKILVVGSGGREHALVWKLRKDNPDAEIFCAPGNGGIAGISNCVPLKATDFDGLTDFAAKNAIDLTVVGPDEPLVLGIVDEFEKKGLRVFGPRKNAAILEGSKKYAKSFMMKYGIPTAAYAEFNDCGAALAYVTQQGLSYPLFIKADGLASGKGAVFCGSSEEAETVVKQIMLEKTFGSSGETIIIEEFLEGREMTLLAFCDGETLIPMVSAQDHKRVYDNDIGLNTGGMGTISPSRLYTAELGDECMSSILTPTLNAMKGEGIRYQGIIYFELMLTANGAKVIEYNCRFGDPEAQVVLPRLKNNLLDVINACIDGQLCDIDLQWDDNAAACIIMASGGYPEAYKTGYEITGLDNAAARDGVVVFHAGTALDGNKLLTAGGRVLGVTAVGADLDAAIKAAYNAVGCIGFQDMYYRKDIGIK